MILVTGATGLVGSEVCRFLKKHSLPFLALKREHSDTTLCDDICNYWIDGDVLDVVRLDKVMQRVDTVIHCAAMVSFDEKQVDEMMRINVTGTQNIVNCCLGNNVANLIHISSVAALGRSKETKVVTEKAQWMDSSLNTKYAKSKYLGEVEVWRGESEGLNVCVINPSVVLAAGDGQRSSSKLLQYVWDEHRFYISRQLNYVDVRDVARAIIKIYKENIWGKRYILNGGTVPYEVLFRKLAKKLGKKMPGWNITFKYPGLWVLLSKVWSFISNSPQLISCELMKTMKEDFIYSSDKIRQDLQFEFTDSEDTFDWVSKEFIQTKSSK